MTEAGQSALPRRAVAQNSQAHQQHLAPTKTLPKKWVVGIFYASLQHFYKRGLFFSDQIMLCAPWGLTQRVDITEVLLALIWTATMQTGIILFSLGIFILDSNLQGGVESGGDLKPVPYTSGSQTSWRHQQRLENFEIDFVFERKPAQKAQKTLQAVCRGSCFLSWTCAFPPKVELGDCADGTSVWRQRSLESSGQSPCAFSTPVPTSGLRCVWLGHRRGRSVSKKGMGA